MGKSLEYVGQIFRVTTSPIPGVSCKVMGSFASFTGSESWLKESACSDFMEVSQLAVFPFLEFDDPSRKVAGKILIH